MGTRLGIGTLLFTLMLINGPGNIPEHVNACCSDGGRCTGSSYCTACTNCSGCKHCNSGGSCGVCAGSSTRSRSSGTTRPSNNLYSTPSSTSGGTSSGSTYQQKTQSSGTALVLIVTSQESNLRAGPSSEFDALELLALGDQLLYLGKEGAWVHVESPNGKKGLCVLQECSIYKITGVFI